MTSSKEMTAIKTLLRKMKTSEEITVIKTLLRRMNMRIDALEYASRNTDYPDKVIERLEDVENEIKQLKVR